MGIQTFTSSVSILILLVDFSYSNTEDMYSDLYGEVVFTHILFRHGERMPLEFYPNDPYKDPAHWPLPPGQLTTEGRLQHYHLGQWLRKKYNHLLSSKYDENEIYVESTDLDRTLISAACNLAGLYLPNTSSQLWEPSIYWQPVPIHTLPMPIDIHLGATSTALCARYNVESEILWHSKEIQEISGKYHVMYEYVTKHAGMIVNDFKSALKVYDALAIEEAYNKTLPEWTKPVYPEPLREAGLLSFALPTWTPPLQQLKMGPLLGEITKHFIQKRDGTLKPNRTMWVYSAHDQTVAALLNTFGAFEIHFPPYAAAVLLELRQKAGLYYVTVFYRNNTSDNPHPISVLNCKPGCSLDDFIKTVKPLIIPQEDWLRYCNSSYRLMYFSGFGHSYSGLLFVFLFITLVTVITASVIVIRKNPNNWYYSMRTPATQSKCKGVVCDNFSSL